MSFSRIRMPGGWTDNSVVAPSEFEAFDANLSNAIDGAGGGAYAPTSPLIIGGAGLQLSAGLVVTSGATALEGLLAVVGDADFFGDATFNGHAEFTLGAEFDGATTFNAATTFSVASLFNANLSCTATVHTSNLTVDGASLFVGSPTFEGGATVQDELIFSDAGHPRYRVQLLADANQTISVSTADYWALNAALTADRTWMIDDLGAHDGDVLKVSVGSAANVGVHIVTLQGSLGALGTLRTAAPAAELLRIGGIWIVLGNSAAF